MAIITDPPTGRIGDDYRFHFMRLTPNGIAHKRLPPPSPLSHRASVSPSQYSLCDGHIQQVVDSLVIMTVAFNGLLYLCSPRTPSSSFGIPPASFPVPVQLFVATLLNTPRESCAPLRHVGTLQMSVPTYVVFVDSYMFPPV